MSNQINIFKFLLSFPSIFVTAAVTMMAPFIECQVWSGGVISALNAILLLIISLTNYLKYETSIEAYIQNAKQYDIAKNIKKGPRLYKTLSIGFQNWASIDASVIKNRLKLAI